MLGSQNVGFELGILAHFHILKKMTNNVRRKRVGCPSTVVFKKKQKKRHYIIPSCTHRPLSNESSSSPVRTLAGRLGSSVVVVGRQRVAVLFQSGWEWWKHVEPTPTRAYGRLQVWGCATAKSRPRLAKYGNRAGIEGWPICCRNHLCAPLTSGT